MRATPFQLLCKDAHVTVLRKQLYRILANNGAGLFDPTRCNLTISPSRGFGRGFRCNYAILGKQLLLTKLILHIDEKQAAMADRGEGPKVFGEVPKRYLIHGYSRNLHTGEVRTRWQSDDFEVHLNQAIDFSGGLVLCRTIVPAKDISVSFPPIYRFRVVYEAMFHHGRLVKMYDRSRRMAAFRALLPCDDISKLKHFIAASFRHEYSLHRTT